MRNLLILIMVALFGCKEDKTIPKGQVVYKVITNVQTGIKPMGTIDDVITSTQWDSTFVFNGQTTGSPDLSIQAYRKYTIDCDSIGDNNTPGYITTQIWYEGNLVASNTISTPTYDIGQFEYLVSECSYDIE
jgi:hypothetical protein